MSDVALWADLPATVQDAIFLVLLLVPAALAGAVMLRGYRSIVLAGAMLWRFRWTSLVFVALIAASVAVGVGLIAQERALRQGTASAADKFDLIIAAPGSEVTILLAAVYLQPSDVPLLSGDIFQEIAASENARIVAPLAFGDSYVGAPVVGTTAAFVAHLAGNLPEGRLFADHEEAVAGATAPVTVGQRFSPDHGIGDAASPLAHAGHTHVIVGRMPPTGSPWDRAILVPIEAVWEVHGLANGHAPESDEQLGPPFDPDYFPGTPAVVVAAEELSGLYALRAAFNRADSMAFFPGTVLANLHSLLGDVRQAMSGLALVTQILVAAGVLCGLVILMRLFSRQIALLRALGAPRRFIFAVIWNFTAILLALGSLLGVIGGMAVAVQISSIITTRTDILVNAAIGWPELHLAAAFFSVTALMAFVPATAVLYRPVIADLRR